MLEDGTYILHVVVSIMLFQSTANSSTGKLEVDDLLWVSV